MRRSFRLEVKKLQAAKAAEKQAEEEDQAKALVPFIPQQGDLPPYFNPRAAANMPYKEKVVSWMKAMSFDIDGDDISVDGYPAVVVSSAQTESNLELGNNDEAMELQARKITRYVTASYRCDSQDCCRGEPDSSHESEIDPGFQI